MSQKDKEHAPSREISIFDIPGFSYGRKFGLLGRLYFDLLAERLKHLGIEKNFSVLVLIDKMGDHCTQKFIAETLHIDKTMMVGFLDDLVGLDLVKRVQNPSDRREYWIQLTDKGIAHMPEIRAMVEDMNSTIMEGIAPAEVEKFVEHLQLIYKNIQTISQS